MCQNTLLPLVSGAITSAANVHPRAQGLQNLSHPAHSLAAWAAAEGLLGPPVAPTSWAFRPSVDGLPSQPPVPPHPAPGALHVACPFPGMQLRPEHAFQPTQRQSPLTPLMRTVSESSAGTPVLFRTTTQSLQEEGSFASSAMVSALSSAVVTPAAPAAVAQGSSPLHSPASCQAVAAGQETVLPSADERQLHALISRLRVALDTRETAAAGMQEQVRELQAQLVACDVVRRALQLRLMEGQQGGAAAAGLPPSMLEGLSREAQAAAEGDALRLQVAALQGEVEATAQAFTQVRWSAELGGGRVESTGHHRPGLPCCKPSLHFPPYLLQEQERLAMEAAQCRLLCRARARQLEQLQALLAEAVASRGSHDTAAAARVEAAEVQAAAAQGEAQQAQERAAAAEAAAAAAERDRAAAQRAAEEASAR